MLKSFYVHTRNSIADMFLFNDITYIPVAERRKANNLSNFDLLN